MTTRVGHATCASVSRSVELGVRGVQAFARRGATGILSAPDACGRTPAEAALLAIGAVLRTAVAALERLTAGCPARRRLLEAARWRSAG
jgi:hypothetical protein